MDPNLIESLSKRRILIVLTLLPYTVAAVFCGAWHFVKVLWGAAAYHWKPRAQETL